MNFSDIPASMYVMSGSLSIALISCLSAYATVVYNKENKISDFRQEWANELRNDSSELIAKLNQLSVITSSFMILNENKMALSSVVEKKYEHILMVIELKSEVKKLVSKIRIMLNPNNLNVPGSIENEINKKMCAIEGLINDAAQDCNQDKVITIGNELDNLEAKLGELIKDNWKLVKSGEPAYRRAKSLTFYASIIMFIFIVIAAITIGISLNKSKVISDDSLAKSNPIKLQVVISNVKCYYPLKECQ